MKSYYLLKETPDKKAGALLAVVFDRFIGLVALVAITVTLIGLRYDFLAQTTETRNLLWLLLFLLGTSVLTLISTFVISGFNLFHSLPGEVPGPRQTDRNFCRLSSLRTSLARHARCVRGVFGSTSRHVRDVSLCRLRVGRAGTSSRLLCCDASGTHHLCVTHQFRWNWPSGKSFANHAQRPLRSPGSKGHSHWLS
jgi:Uncharacterised protein family (UPF0104).